MIDIYYGLRNLSVGDEEETRIADLIEDVEPAPVRHAVAALVAIGEYATAYEVAIRQALRHLGRERPLTREHVEAGAASWVADWRAEDDAEDDEPDITVAELMAVYDDIQGRT